MATYIPDCILPLNYSILARLYIFLSKGTLDNTPLHSIVRNMLNTRKNITFLEVNSSYSHTMLSYGYLRAYTEKLLPEWKWDHVTTTINDDEDRLILRLLAAKPAVICATLYLFNHEYVVRVLRKLKSLLPDTSIILGGPEFLGNNEAFLRRNPEIDAVLRGDESSFHLMLDYISDPSKWNGIPGACFIRDGRYSDNGFAKFADDMDGIPSPYEKGYFTRDRPFCQIETSRGCSGKCSFCTSSLSEGTRYFSLDRIRSEIDCVDKAGIREIRIVDRTFNEDKPRAQGLLELFRTYPDSRFHLEINPALVDNELMKELSLFKMKKLHIEAGIQTLCAKSLKAVKRFGSSTKMLTGLRKLMTLKNADLHVDLIAGLPLQNYRDVLSDVRKLISLNPHEIQLENLKILPGTPISHNPSGIAWNPLPPYEVLKTGNMEFDELSRTKKLSRMLDSFLNIPKLKQLFKFGFRRDKNFLEKFLMHVEQNSDPSQKQHLDKRLLLIKDYGDKHDPMLAELTVFFWLSGGFDPDKFNIEAERIKPSPATDGIHEKTIFSSDTDIVPSRIATASFGFNAGDIWLDAMTEVRKKKHIYRFFTAHGNRIVRICH